MLPGAGTGIIEDVVAKLPLPRGPLSGELVDVLSSAVDDDRSPLRAEPRHGAEDRALSLWVLHELHYRGFDGVDEAWEWSPALARLRRDLESDLEGRLRARHAAARDGNDTALVAGEALDDVGDAVLALAAAHDGPSLARHVQRTATYTEVVELLRQRSIYHLKEADPTSWTVPRLEAGPKAALLQVQYDEYGVGDPERLHHAIFARGLSDAGIDATYGAHIDAASLETLEQNNTMSMFGLQRRLRAAAVGHFAAFEATSSVPSRQMVQGLQRLGFPDSLVAYYDEHVEADAVHEQVAARALCGSLVAEDPTLHDDVLFGAWTCLDLESRSAAHLLATWSEAAA